MKKIPTFPEKFKKCSFQSPELLAKLNDPVTKKLVKDTSLKLQEPQIRTLRAAAGVWNELLHLSEERDP